MILRIAVFGIVLFGTTFLQRSFLSARRIIVPDIIFLSFLLGVFLILLYLEIESFISQENVSMKKLRWRGFHFTFWTGILWSALFSFSRDYRAWFTDPVQLMGLLAGLALGGVIFGVMGMAITQFMLSVVFKLKDEE